MGNRVKCLFSPDLYGDWMHQSECCHSRRGYKVIEIRWIKVPMTSNAIYGLVEVIRIITGILTLGTSTIVYGGIKDLSHECIEITYVCECCGSSQKFTAEIMGDKYKLFSCGYYRKKCSVRLVYNPTSMTVEYVRNKFDEMGDSLCFIINNCYHWSNELWDKLCKP